MRRTHGSEGAPVRQRTGATRLGDENGGSYRADAGDLIEPGCRGRERGDHLLDLGVELGDVGVDGVDPGQHLGQQKRVVLGEVAGERLFQRADLAAHPGAGQLGEGLGVAFPGDQGGHHRPAGLAEDVAGRHRQLDAGVFQQLFHPVLLRCPGADQVGAVAGDITQPADRRRRHEAGPDHLPLGHLAQPDAIQLVRFRQARQVLHVLGVDQPGLEPMRLQHVKRRPPVVRRCLHHHPGHSQAGQPVGQRQQRTGHRGIRLHFLQPAARLALVRDAHAAHQLGLADVQRRDPLDDLLPVGGLLQHPAPPRPPDRQRVAARRNRKGTCRN